MFNIHFSEQLEKGFREDLQEKLKLTLRETDTFMFKVRALFVSEEQIFPTDFQTPSKIIRRIADRTGKDYDDAKKEVLEDPVILFDALKIPHIQVKKAQVSPVSMSALSPAMRLQLLRQRPLDRTRTFSLETSDLLAAHAREKPSIGKIVTRDYVEKQKQDRKAPAKRTKATGEKSKKGSRTKPVPTFEALAKAAHLIKQETGKSPNAKSGNKHLPSESPQWSTLIQHVLKGENSLSKIMKRYPMQAEEALQEQAPAAAQAVQVFDAFIISQAQEICPAKVKAADVEILLDDKKVKASDVFNGLMRIARKKVLPTTSSAFHYIEGKTLRQVDTLLKKGEVSGIESFLSLNQPTGISSLNDFMLATGIAKKDGPNLVLSKPSELNKLAKTFG